MVAARYGHVSIVECLLKSGSDENMVDKVY